MTGFAESGKLSGKEGDGIQIKSALICRKGAA